ncbi:CHAT domain-containing protein [Candidatus Halobeggiatoa sp. HSG11]|nr:CHAT domain-containing protein [Candidatus Halobeggiatoa sp. HSG11]
MGQYQKALTNYQQALEIHREIGNKLGEGASLGNIGSVYRELEQYQKALFNHQQALEINREIGHKHGEGVNLINIGNVYKNIGQYQKALSYSQQSLEIDREIGNKHGEAIDLDGIGIIYKKLGEYQKAKTNFQDCTTILETIRSDDLWKAQCGLASVEAKLNQPESAIQHYVQALDNLEKLRAGLSIKEYKTSFMRNKIGVYDELIALLQSQHSKQPNKGYDRKAFEIFERKQGRLFLEEMGQSGARRFTGLDNEIIETEQSLVLKRQNTQSLSPQEYTALEQAEEMLKKRIKAKHPKYYALKYPQPVDLETLQNQVLQKGEMMLIYGVMEKNIVLWVIGRQHFQMFTLPVDENTLKQKIENLRALFNPLFKNKFLQASNDLYQTLLPEAARKLIKNAETLYIIPTGPLYGLPFGSLVTSNPKQPIRYFIEDYPISYLSSASLLKIIRDEERKTQPPEPFLAFADPNYPSCNFTLNIIRKIFAKLRSKPETFAGLRTKSYLKSIKGNCFTRLAATANEVREIADLLNADHSKSIYLGNKASRSTIFALNEADKLDDYRYIMFSVHGIIPNKSNQIEQPALVLSNPTKDGYLTMADVFALKLNADFVNLSACNTGCTTKNCSENVRGEGIMGLTRAFMYAGTSRVAVTLWSVDLHSSKDLNIGLFTNLKANQKMAHALRNIKLKMIRGQASSKEYSHPYHWAGFVVYGDGQ